MTYTSTSTRSWNNGALSVWDDACDSHQVHANIFFNNGQMGSAKTNSGGCGTLKAFSGLSYNNSNYMITQMRLQGCVDLTLADQCSYGSWVPFIYP